MDNKIFKNIQYEKDKLNILPYSTENYVKYPNDVVIESNALNYTFNQLANNDKFVANQLLALSGTIAGPKKYLSSDTDMRNAVNGYKMWDQGANDELSIVHKVDRDLQDSIQKTSLSVSTYGFAQFGDITLAATEDGIWQIDSNWNLSKFTNSYYNGKKEDITKCYSIMSNDKVTLFLTNRGVFEANSNLEVDIVDGQEVKKTVVTLRRRNRNDILECIAAYMDLMTNDIFLGTGSGTYIGKYKSSPEADIDFYEIELSKNLNAIQSNVNGFLQLSKSRSIIQNKNDIIATTSNGLFQSDCIDFVKNASKEFLGFDVKFMKRTPNGLFISTSEATYKDSANYMLIGMPSFSCIAYKQFTYIGSCGCLYKYDGIDIIKIPLDSRFRQQAIVKLSILENIKAAQTSESTDLVVCQLYDKNIIVVDVRNDIPVVLNTNGICVAKGGVFSIANEHNLSSYDAYGELVESDVLGNNVQQIIENDISNDAVAYFPDENGIGTLFQTGSVKLPNQKKYFADYQISYAKKTSNNTVSDVRMLYIDGNQLRAIDSNYIIRKQADDLFAACAADTKHVIVEVSDNGQLYTIVKSNFTSAHAYKTDIITNNINALESDVDTLYMHDETSVTALKELCPLEKAFDKRFISFDRVDTDLSSTLIAVCDKNVLSVIQLSTVGDQLQEIEAHTLTANITGGAKFKAENTIELATSTGLSTMQISVDNAHIASLSAVECYLQGKPVLCWKNIYSNNDYMFIGSNNGLSVTHDEYQKDEDINAVNGFTVVNNQIELDHEFFILYANDQLIGYDGREKLFSISSTQVNDVAYTYNATKKTSQFYVATTSGLSAFTLSSTVSGDVSSFTEESLIGISLSNYVALKSQALSSTQCHTYTATKYSIYDLDKSLTSPILENLSNVIDLDGFCTTNISDLIIIDDGVLKKFNCANSKLSTYNNFSGISYAKVVGDDDENATSSSVGIIMLSGTNLLSASYNILSSEDSAASSAVMLLDNVSSLKKEFRLENTLYFNGKKTITAPVRISYIMVYDSANQNAHLINKNGIKQLILPKYDFKYLHKDGSDLVDICAGKDGIYSLREAIRELNSNNVCHDITSIRSENQISVLVMQDNSLECYHFTDNSNIRDISSNTLLDGIQGYVNNGGTLAYLSNECLFLNASNKDDYIAVDNIIAQYDRMLSVDDVVAAAIGISSNILLPCSNGVTYQTDVDRMTVSEVRDFHIDGIYQLKSYNGTVFINDKNNISALISMKPHLVTHSDEEILDFVVTKYNGYKDSIVLVKTNKGQKCSINGDRFTKTRRIPDVFDSYDINEDKIAIINQNGVSSVEFFDAMVPTTNNATLINVHTFNDIICNIATYQEFDGDDIVATLSSYSGQQLWRCNPYDDDRKMALSGNLVGAVGGNLDNNQYFALSGQSISISLGDYNEKYNDDRITLYDATINGIDAIDDKIAICTNKGAFISEGNGKAYRFNYIYGEGTEFTKCFKQNDLTSYVASEKGLYTIVNRGNALSASIYKNSISSDPTNDITSWNFTGLNNTYAYSSNNVILTSSSGKSYSKYLELDLSAGKVNSIVPLNSKDFLFGTDDGTYKTNYMFDLSNDIRTLTDADVSQIYEESEPAFEYEYEVKLIDHQEIDHATSSIIEYTNENFLLRDLSGAQLSAFTRARHDDSKKAIEVKNDIVQEVIFGNEADGEVTVQLSNFLTTQDNAKCSYIIKRYASGLTELYVYIPTTNTYYISHIPGVPGCQASEEVHYRPNLAKFKVPDFAADVSKHKTEFTIGISRATVNIDAILGLEACGNSLPLKCYKEDDSEQAAKHWHSFVLPTECITDVGQLYPTSEGEYKIKFNCFGSDAQAIKFEIYDSLHTANTMKYKIRFNANGAAGTMPMQTFIATDGKSDIEQLLRKCTFNWKSGRSVSFLGWTTTPNPSFETPVMYEDQQAMSMTTKDIEYDGQIIDLYAIWLEYDFENSTTLAIADTEDELFINHADVLEDEILKKKAMIDYGK